MGTVSDGSEIRSTDDLARPSRNQMG